MSNLCKHRCHLAGAAVTSELENEGGTSSECSGGACMLIYLVLSVANICLVSAVVSEEPERVPFRST